MAMRRHICGLLVAPAAFCLLAGVLGFGISVLLVASPNSADAEIGRVGLVAVAVLLVLGAVSLTGALAANRPADRPQAWRSFFRWGVVAAVMVIPTGLLFGPSGAFHHQIGFGPFMFIYMVWNCEDPAPGSRQIVSVHEVWFDPVRFGVLLAIWMAVFAGAVSMVRPARSSATELAGSAQTPNHALQQTGRA